jgi:TolB protein
MIACIISALLSAPGGEIAYLAREPGNRSQVHVVSLESGIDRPVGPRGALDAPQWSPDGAKIAVTVFGRDSRAVHVIDVATGETQRLLHTHANGHGPAWSPDGTRIAYTVSSGLDAQVAVYDVSSNTETLWGGGRTSLASPIWISEATAQMLLDPERRNPTLFQTTIRLRGGFQSLLVAVQWVGAAERATTDLVVVSENVVSALADGLLPSDEPYSEFAPAASDEALAFESNDGGDREIFLMTDRRTFDASNHRTADWRPVWAPNGRSLLFESCRSGAGGIYRVLARPAGRVQPVAVFDDGDAWAPAWAPGGEWITYVCDREGHAKLYVVPADGTEHRAVSPPGTTADLPQWRPLP